MARGAGRMLGLLLWKNWLLQKRRKVLTGFEVGLPPLFMLILLLIRLRVESEPQPNGRQWNSFEVGYEFPERLIPLGFLCNRTAPTIRWDVFYSPEKPVVSRVVQRVAQRLQLHTKGFASENDMVDYYKTVDQCWKSNILAGLVFDSEFTNGDDALPANISYKLRPPAEQYFGRSGVVRFVSASDWYTSLSFPIGSTVGPRSNGSAEGGSRPGYNEEGFLALQRAVDLALIAELNSSAPLEGVETRLKRHPYPPYVADNFINVLQSQFTFIIMLCFCVVAPNICKDIVLEKEKKLKETMKMMGLPSWLHWTAWFIKFAIFQVVAVSLMTLFLHLPTSNGAVLNYTAPSVTWVFLLLYALATVMFCFAISAFFSKANSGAAAGAILYLLTYVPYFFLQARLEDIDGATRMASSLLHNLAMCFGCVVLSQYEGIGVGVQWNNLNTPFSPDNDFSMFHVFMMLLIDCVLYGLITWYFDNILPGDFGLPRPPYFPFTRSYWCGSRSEPDLADYDENHHSEFFEKNSTGLGSGISIRKLTKVFRKGGEEKAAVNDLKLNMYEGQITALLGHNGAGKTTTMMMLTGFLPPTSGTALISGYSIASDIERVRESLGLCPQHNILFDSMTVEEHLTFFAKLKGCPSHSVQSKVDDMVALLRLEDKRSAASSTLSGGMKRKLSVGIALIAGSKTVILDEPTSGMDPQARRHTWDILQSQRHGRTMILSTHFMDEADFLGDRIAIMAHGKVVCCGSSIFLKGKYGVGYHMVMVKEPRCEVDQVRNLVTSFVPSAKLESNVSAELSFVLPHESAGNFEQLFTNLETNKSALGIASFGASVTTLEEVFLKVGEAADGDAEPPAANGVTRDADKINLGADNVVHPGVDNKAFTAEPGCHQDRDPQINVFDLRYDRNEGCRLLLQQFRAMFVKRMIHSSRNLLVTLTQILVPLIFTILGCVVLKTFPGPRDPPAYALTIDQFADNVAPYAAVNSATDETMRQLAQAYTDYLTLNTTVRNVPDVGNGSYVSPAHDFVENYLSKAARENFAQYARSYMVAATFSPEPVNENKTTQVTVHFNNEAYHTPTIALNVMANTLIRAFIPNSDHVISVTNHPFPRDPGARVEEEVNTSFVVAFIIAWTVTFGMAFLVGSFVVFLIKERATKVKHIQFVSGVHTLNFWLSTFVWDMANYLLPSLLLVCVFAAFQINAYVQGSNVGVTILVFVMYGLAVLPFIYLISFLFTVPASGFTWVTVLVIFTGTAASLAVLILKFPDLNTMEVAQALEWTFYVLLPNFCFSNALQDMYTNAQNKLICEELDASLNVSRQLYCLVSDALNVTNPCCFETCGDFCADYHENPLAWEYPGIGRPVVFMLVQSCVCFFILLVSESNWASRCWQRAVTGSMTSSTPRDSTSAGGQDFAMVSTVTNSPSNSHNRSQARVAATDNDVQVEKERLERTPVVDLMLSDSLILRKMVKYYGSLVAVDSLSVGIPQGECFGLLGINGAGKTSTFKMLTGDETLSSGEAYVGGHGVTTNIKKVQRQIGYCPQFDALIDQMTVTETLRMYARLRGVGEAHIDDVINTLIKSLHIEEYAKKQAGQLSGGNKRKLSTAIALIGDPPIIFLDEPTTGMDPVARRLLWDTLSRVRASGRTLILTSHSMEECEALCTRIAIMVNGQFKCLGSTQHLKNKFSEGYILIGKVQSPEGAAGGAAHVSRVVEERVAAFMAWVEGTFPGSVLKDKHEGMVQYQVASHGGGSGSTLGQIFGAMERAKERFHLEDYSVSQTSLEQVFLNFARAQVEPREKGMSRSLKCRNCCRFIWCCGCCC